MTVDEAPGMYLQLWMVMAAIAGRDLIQIASRNSPPPPMFPRDIIVVLFIPYFAGFALKRICSFSAPPPPLPSVSHTHSIPLFSPSLDW